MYNEEYFDRLIQFRNEVMEFVYACLNGEKDAYPEFAFDGVSDSFENLEQWEIEHNILAERKIKMKTNDIKMADNKKLISELKWLSVCVFNSHGEEKTEELKEVEDEIFSRMNK